MEEGGGSTYQLKKWKIVGGSIPCDCVCVGIYALLKVVNHCDSNVLSISAMQAGFPKRNWIGVGGWVR